TSKMLVSEACETADPLAKREFKRGNRRQLITQVQYFQRLVPGRIDHPAPLAETVAERASFWRRCGDNCRGHASLSLDKPRLNWYRMRELCRFALHFTHRMVVRKALKNRAFWSTPPPAPVPRSRQRIRGYYRNVCGGANSVRPRGCYR